MSAQIDSRNGVRSARQAQGMHITQEIEQSMPTRDVNIRSKLSYRYNSQVAVVLGAPHSSWIDTSGLIVSWHHPSITKQYFLSSQIQFHFISSIYILMFVPRGWLVLFRQAFTKLQRVRTSSLPPLLARSGSCQIGSKAQSFASHHAKEPFDSPPSLHSRSLGCDPLRQEYIS
ncbi:hypothetical protein IAQ61_006089 [Plenodomus lingam]|uniref:uncharacterized protein n=1 Tax=Leptosphaeria maculans TaxID=5022 RepID=UPI00332D51ED|nr:hypothetical protein IAQ61_006089 [Plenodomus lingam]